MKEIEIIMGLLLAMALLLALAAKMKIPYPILLVVGGLGIGFIPGLPRVELNPELVFILFLPPLLQAAGYNTPIRDFKANLRSITLLAVGLVLFTTVIIAVVAHSLIEGLPWAAAFVLGAIISPPDAVAATSIAQNLKLPRRIVTVLEGESLVNDATALVAYRVAIVAVSTGVFSFMEAGLTFLLAAVGGLVIGLALGWVTSRLFQRLNDISVGLIISFLAGYGAYLLAEQLKVSGVIAVVALGIYLGRRGTLGVSAETRIQTVVVWNSVISLLNGWIFILIGLQLPLVLENLREPIGTLIFYTVVINLTVIVTRIVWVYPATYLPRYILRRLGANEPYPAWQWTTVIAWTGMRGVVSLAAALSLPVLLASGTPFPQRDLIIFLTFTVILVTLVLQGLSLPWLIKLLKVKDDGSEEREEAKARLVAAKAGLAKLEELANEDWVAQEMVVDINEHYQSRIRRFGARYRQSDDRTEETMALSLQKLQKELFTAEFEALVKLRDKGVINDDIMRRVLRDLDLESLRLSSVTALED